MDQRIPIGNLSQEAPKFGPTTSQSRGEKLRDQSIWANLVNFTFDKTVQYYRIRLTCVDEEKADFGITIEKDQNLRQRVLSTFNVQQKLNDMFVGRQVQNDTLIKVIETSPDKTFEAVFTHDNETYNLEMAIELQGEKTDQKSVLAYCRDILTIFQKNVIKQLRQGKSCQFDPATRESIRGAEHIDLVTGLDLNMNVYKPATLKLNIDYKVTTIFNRDVTHFMREEFSNQETVTQDQLMAFLKGRKFTDTDNKLYLDDLEPKKENYTPVECMNLNAVMYRSIRNMKFKRDPLTIRLSSIFFCVENKDIHSNEMVKSATKRKMMKDFQFFQFANNTLNKLCDHWIFKENGINFQRNFNLIPVERSLSCTIQLGGNDLVSTHDQNGEQDKNQNNIQKNKSTKLLNLQQESLHWLIVQEKAPYLKENINGMINKFQRQLGNLYNINVKQPVECDVEDLKQFNKWNEINQFNVVVFVLNSRAKKDAITKKQETIKYYCHKQGEVPNQIVLTKTFEQHDFLKLVTLNLMQDIIMKLPNSIGHRIQFDTPLNQWLNGSTMVFAMDVCHRKGQKSVASVLSYLTSDYTNFRSDYIVKDEEQSELKQTDECKQKFKDVIKKCILDFEHNNKTTVKRILFLRDGITDFQRRYVEQTEIAQINEVLSELTRDNAQLWFITANKRISTKIFEWNARDNKLNHLEAGIQVDRDLVKDSNPSFQLNSSNNRLSKCCYYECLYPKQLENQVDFDHIMSLTFKLSFMYFHAQNLANISVPGLLKYAEKKASFFSIVNSLKGDEEEGKDMFDTKDSSVKRKRN